MSTHALELLEAFEEHVGEIDVLSLDCFDTLLWRRCAQPTDVFYDLQHAPAFLELGFNPLVRMRAESAARSMSVLRQSRGEVCLADIYRSAFPALSDEQVLRLAAEELAAEKQACFGFPPVVGLVRRARARGIRIVVASDTYLTKAELRELLASTLPADVTDAIERIYCSCEIGRSKSDGLFPLMVSDLRVRPERVLHIGDNRRADFDGARLAKMRAIHLQQHQPIAEEILRLATNFASVLVPELRSAEGMPSPFRPIFALAAPKPNPEYVLGALGVGPILYAFARFVLDEVTALRDAGKRPRVIFLMRDAHLPQQVCNALAGCEFGHSVALSRFASNAASFCSKQDIEQYLALSAGSGRFKEMANQLLLPAPLAKTIVAKAESRRQGTDEFLRRVLSPDTIKAIVRESARYRQRLYAYLKRHAGIEAGDTLVLVDIGYEGTAQRQLQPLLERELGVEVAGRYLLAARTAGWERSRKGLMDPSWCDDRVTHSLVPYAGLLEDLCTSNDGSVIDYTEAGDVIRADRVLGDEQYSRIKPVQSACVEFCRAAQAFFDEVGSHPGVRDLSRSALGALARLLFAPSEAEIAYLEGFRLDMNLATVDSFALFDREAGLAGLRRRGLFFMESNLKTLRTNYPIEARCAGVELGVTLLAQRRFGLSFTQNDLNLRREAVGVLGVRGAGSGAATATAMATHDGFFSLVVPVGDCDFDVGILLGQSYRWFEIDSVHLVPTKSLLTDRETLDMHDITDSVHFEGIERRGKRIFECQSPNGFLFIHPQRPADAGIAGDTYACRVVFRPLERRDPIEPRSAETSSSAADAGCPESPNQ